MSPHQTNTKNMATGMSLLKAAVYRAAVTIAFGAAMLAAGCNADTQQESPTATRNTSPDPELVRQRLAAPNELAVLESTPGVALSQSFERDNTEPTSALIYREEDGKLRTCFITPVQLSPDRMILRLATETDDGYRAVIMVVSGQVTGNDPVFSSESLEFLTTEGIQLARYDRKEDRWTYGTASQALAAGMAGNWWYCFLKCVDRTLARWWWLDAICGAGSPISQYYCLLAQGGLAWGIIAYCIGSASGYCP